MMPKKFKQRMHQSHQPSGVINVCTRRINKSLNRTKMEEIFYSQQKSTYFLPGGPVRAKLKDCALGKSLISPHKFSPHLGDVVGLGVGHIVSCDWEQGVQRLVGNVWDFGMGGSSQADPRRLAVAVWELLEPAGRTPGQKVSFIGFIEHEKLRGRGTTHHNGDFLRRTDEDSGEELSILSSS